MPKIDAHSIVPTHRAANEQSKQSTQMSADFKNAKNIGDSLRLKSQEAKPVVAGGASVASSVERRYLVQDKLQPGRSNSLIREASAHNTVMSVAPKSGGAIGSAGEASATREATSITGRTIGEEFAPKVGKVRIGIELEGIGSVHSTWNKSGTKAINTTAGKERLGEVLKRTPLLRSPSFNEELGRGVAIHSEWSKTLGTQAPGELVSSPHVFDVKNLDLLRASFKKTLQTDSISSRTQKTIMNDPRLPPDDPFNKSQAETRWARVAIKAGGSLQTTIGIAVGKLLSDDRDTRIKVVNLLVGEDKRQVVRDLLYAAICIEQHLTAESRPLSAYQGDGPREGIRLAVFMYLTNLFKDQVRGTLLPKAAYGALFKGDSSFLASNVADSNDILSSRLERKEVKDELMATLVQMMQDKKKLIAPWVVEGVVKGVALSGKEKSRRKFDLSDIGRPGLSLQVDVRKWFSIPNFLHNNRLHIVVEAREKSAGLNQMMAEFLNEKIEAKKFYDDVRVMTLNK
jgi:hypothetical protein